MRPVEYVKLKLLALLIMDDRLTPALVTQILSTEITDPNSHYSNKMIKI